MNKIVAILCLLILPAFNLSAGTAQPVFFKGDYNKALAKAKKEGKPILLLFVSEDCASCEKIEGIIKTDNETATLLAKNFVVLRLNPFKDEGYKVAKVHKVHEVPACIYLDDKGEKILGPAISGTVLNNANNCIKLLAYRKTAAANATDLNFQGAYADLIQRYFRNTENADSITAKYLRSLTEESLKDSLHAKEAFELAPLALRLIDVNTPLNVYLMANKEWYYSRFGKTETDARLIKIAFSSAEQAIDRKDSALFTRSVAQMLQFPEYTGKITSYQTIIGPNFVEVPNLKQYRLKYLRFNEPREFMMYEKKQMERIWNNPDSLIAFAKDYLDYYSSNKLRMTKARDCMHRSIELKNSYTAQCTLAAVFYALELETEAEEVAIKAKAMARETKEDYSDAVLLLEKIKNKRKYKELR